MTVCIDWDDFGLRDMFLGRGIYYDRREELGEF